MMRLHRIIWFLVIALLAVIMCLPLYSLLLSSILGTREAIDQMGVVFLTAGDDVEVAAFAKDAYANLVVFVQYPTLRHYIELLLDTPEFFVMFWNSMKQEVLILAGQLLFGMPAAWAFARYEFPLKRTLFTTYTVLMVLPFQVTMVSSYLVLDQLHFMNTMWAVVIPNMFSTFPIFLITKFFQGIPLEVLEAARLDGASEWTLFRKIGIPLGAPGVLAAVILGFIEYWNNVEQPLAFLKEKSQWPLSLYVTHIDTKNIGLSMVAAVISLLPAVLLFLAGQKYLEAGVAKSTLKGGD